MVEEGGKALAAYMKPREEGKIKPDFAEDVADMVKTVGQVAEYWLSDPQRTVELQTSLGRAYLDLWASAAKRLTGEAAAPVVAPDPKDKRFADPEWSQNQFFDFLKQLYLLTAQWADQLVKDASLDEHTRQKAEFYVTPDRQCDLAVEFRAHQSGTAARDALAPTPRTSCAACTCWPRTSRPATAISRSASPTPSNFEVGRNLALTPGKVIFQNDLMQLIQYAATTEEVLKVPLLIVPPWINKFYILDLTPEKSFIKWCVDQGSPCS